MFYRFHSSVRQRLFLQQTHSLARANHVHQREHAKYTDGDARTAAVSDAAYAAGWNGVTTIAPSKNAVYDKIQTLGGATIATGSYTGNDASARQITTGFKPSFVVIIESATLLWFWLLIPSYTLRVTDGGAAFVDDTVETYIHATDGFVVDVDDANNTDPRTHYYWAISE